MLPPQQEPLPMLATGLALNKCKDEVVEKYFGEKKDEKEVKEFLEVWWAPLTMRYARTSANADECKEKLERKLRILACASGIIEYDPTWKSF